MTRSVDVEVAIAAGADAIGIALLARSRRAVETSVAARLVAAADGRVEVFMLMDQGPESGVQLAHELGATGITASGA